MTYTQVSNFFIDTVMRQISPSAVLCYMVICRKTSGWQKEYDTISISQFVDYTGLTKPTIIKALRELTDYGVINVDTSSRITSYGLSTVITLPKDACCNGQTILPIDLDGKKSLPSVGKKSLPADTTKGKKSLPTSVKNLNPQKKEKKYNSTTSSRVQRETDTRLSQWQFTVYRELTHLHVPHAFRDRVAMLTNEILWRDVITRWIGRGYRVNGIGGMLDWYDKENTQHGRHNGQSNGGSSSSISVEDYIASNRQWLD